MTGRPGRDAGEFPRLSGDLPIRPPGGARIPARTSPVEFERDTELMQRVLDGLHLLFLGRDDQP